MGMNRNIGALVIVLASLGAYAVRGSSFREILPIPRPDRLPAGAQAVRRMAPVERATVDRAVRDLMKSWNTPEMESKLGSGLFDRSRLGDAMVNKVTRDARLRVLGVQGSQTLNQYYTTDAQGRSVRVSKVAVQARTQLEFNSPSGGFERREGTNELHLVLTQLAPPGRGP